MDLVAGVRKEGSRGGRADFKWEDVKEDQHRENYLGHSLMAPVGRWQKNRDLSWYANSSTTPTPTAVADARAEEIRRIKEAEQDALSVALGYPVAPRPSNNANLQPLGEKEVRKAVKEAADDEDDDGGRGMGFDGGGGVKIEANGVKKEIMEGMSEGRGGLNGGDGALVRRETGKEEERAVSEDTEDMMMKGKGIGGTDRGLEKEKEKGMPGEGDHVLKATSGGGTTIDIRGRGGIGVTRRHDGGGRVRGTGVIGVMIADGDVTI